MDIKEFIKGTKVENLTQITQGDYFIINGKVYEGVFVRSWSFRQVWDKLLDNNFYRAYKKGEMVLK